MINRIACIFILLSFLLSTGCADSRPQATESVPLQPSTTPAISSTLSPTLTPTSSPTYSFGLDTDYMEGAQMIDEQNILAHVEYLAGDEMQGRLVGTPGHQLSGDYIAARFAEYGLQPAGTDGGYFQPFTTSVTLNVEQPVLSIINPGGEIRRTFITHDEYVPRIPRYLGSGDATDQVVWLGSCNSAAFNSTLAGQIILCRQVYGEELTQAVNSALQYRVGGLLLFTEENGPYTRSGYGINSAMIDIPAFRIPSAVAEELLAGSPYTLDGLDQLAVPTTLNTTVHVANTFERSDTQARNILGLLPGSDPLLKNEIIIAGAHYDHVGVDPDGTIYNGANDNASGVATILEIARLWQAQGYRPARSVLFAAWDAEEQGLCGSTYYVSRPVFSLQQTRAYLNLDMLGVGDIVLIYGVNEMADQLRASAEAFGVTVDIRDEYLADDLPFYVAGIPTGLYIRETESLIDTYMHTPEDDPQVLQLENLRMMGILAAHVLYHWSVED